MKDFPDEAVLHEIIHSFSTDYYSNKLYAENAAIEEAAVQLLTREISKVEGIKPVKSTYDTWAEILRGFNGAVKAYQSDLQFAKRLIRIPPDRKMDWLVAKAQKLMGGSLDELTRAIEPLYKIDWEVLASERARTDGKNS